MAYTLIIDKNVLNTYTYFVNNLIKKLFYEFRSLKNVLDIKTLKFFYKIQHNRFSLTVFQYGAVYTTQNNVIPATNNLLIKIILDKPK